MSCRTLFETSHINGMCSSLPAGRKRPRSPDQSAVVGRTPSTGALSFQLAISIQQVSQALFPAYLPVVVTDLARGTRRESVISATHNFDDHSTVLVFPSQIRDIVADVCGKSPYTAAQRVVVRGKDVSRMDVSNNPFHFRKNDVILVFVCEIR